MALIGMRGRDAQSRSASSTIPAAEVADLLVDVAVRRAGTSRWPAGRRRRRAYELAAESDADLSAATLWLGDERVVPPDDERSNLRMVRERADRPAARGAAPAADAGRHARSGPTRRRPRTSRCCARRSATTRGSTSR